MNIKDESLLWYLGEPNISAKAVQADRELVKKRERRRIDNHGSRRLNSSSHYKTSISHMIGRSREKGNAIESGRFLELWLPYEDFHTGNGVEGEKKAKEHKPGEGKESHESIAQRVNHRARKQIRRIVNANDFRGMLTLTMALPSAENNEIYATVSGEKQRGYDHVRGLFKAFVKRCRRACLPFEYVAVFEQHNSEKTSEEKRYCWHIHLAVSSEIPYMADIRAMWWHGITDYQDYNYDKKGKKRDKTIENPGAYMAEYIGKAGEQFGERELLKKRRYTTSRGVKRSKKKSLSSVEIGGTMEGLIYCGKRYALRHIDFRRIPGTNKMQCNAHYIITGGQEL